MDLSKYKLTLTVHGSSELAKAVEDVNKKTEELNKAIQRLNKIELTLKTELS